MADKPKRSRPKKATSTGRAEVAPTRGKPKSVKPAQKKQTFYVHLPQLTAIVSDQKPTGSKAQPFATFDEARKAAIDTLVEMIEDAEAALAVLKRASACEDLSENSSA